MSFYPRLNFSRLHESNVSKVKQGWIDLYVKAKNSTDYVRPKSFELLRANFGANDGTAQVNIQEFLRGYAKISQDSYTIEKISKKTYDPDVSNQISGEFDSYKIRFIKPATDVFGKEYNEDDFLIITNRFKFDEKRGEIGVIGRKDLSPDKIGLNSVNFYLDPNSIISKVIEYLNQQPHYPDHYKEFIVQISKNVAFSNKNADKYESFVEYAEASDDIIYTFDSSIFKDIDSISIERIQNDYGEILGGLMFLNVIEKLNNGIKYPKLSNQRLIDFFVDDFKISSKGTLGGTPSGDTIVGMIYDAYEANKISFNTPAERDFFENVISTWTNPVKHDSRSEIYNIIMSLSQKHLSDNEDSAYKFLRESAEITGKLVKRSDILAFLDKLSNDKSEFVDFMTEFIDKSGFFKIRFNTDFYYEDYMQKKLSNNSDRIGIIFYPIMIELVTTLNRKYATLLTQYTQRVTDIKQIYLDISVKTGKLTFKSKPFKVSSFLFERRGSINYPFLSNIGIKIKS